jgi:endoglucanase
MHARIFMKFCALFTIALLLMVSAACAQPKELDAFAQDRLLGRGVNIIGYDPIWRSRERARFQEKHFRLLKEAGFNSVRINLAPFRRMDASNQWAISESWFKVLDWAVAGARKQGLAVILDLHEYTAMGKDPEGNRAKFLAAWRQLSAHCQNEPGSVFFEVLNEPNGKLTPELWNQYLREALAIIRETNPTRTVIAGPAFWNSVDHLRELELPENDRHLIVTVHYYKPMEFTHQGAAWTGQQDKLGVDWLGTEKDLAAIDKDFDSVAAWASEHKRPIFLGEFGAYDKGPMESRARYTAAVARAAEKRGWSWAYWQFDSDFILYDIDRDAWVEPIKRSLIPEGKL